MARFRGTVRGGRGTASRLGHAKTGLTLEGRSWGGSVTTNIFVKQGTDEDWVSVYHMDNNGVCTNLYYGPLNKWVNPRLERIEFIPLWDGHNPHE